MLPRAAAPRQHTDTSYIPSQHGQGGALARHSSARARLVGTEAPKILSLLASLGERPLQPQPGAPLGGPRHNVPFPGLFPFTTLQSIPGNLCGWAAPRSFKHPGLDTKAAPKLPLTLTLSTGMCCSVAHSPCPGTHLTSTSPRAGAPLLSLVLCQDLMWLCHASLASLGLGKQQSYSPQPPPYRDTHLCHRAQVLSL